MKSKSLLISLITLSACFTVSVAQAHHSFPALFDPSKDVSVVGIVTEFQFQAPHCYIRVDVADENGGTTQWELETTSPGQLIRMDLTPKTLKPGDKISATGNPSRDGRPLMRLLTITLPDGEEKRIQ